MEICIRSHIYLGTKILIFFALTCGEVITASGHDCTCVPYYQCRDDSGELITDGQGLLDFRILETNPCKGDLDVCCNVTNDALFPSTDAPEQSFGCGYRTFGSFPWYAALFFQEQETDHSASVYKCGVSLINPKAVLTAAHCIKKEGVWSVRIGTVIRKVSKIIKHPKYNQITMQNDIALAILTQPVKISKEINTICIAPQRTVLDDAHCTVTTRLNNNKEGGTKHTCVGDGGSPLVCPIPGQPDRYHQVGIVSWGIGCGVNEVPDIYVKLSTFRDWIDTEMVRQGLDVTSYRY